MKNIFQSHFFHATPFDNLKCAKNWHVFKAFTFSLFLVFLGGCGGGGRIEPLNASAQPIVSAAAAAKPTARTGALVATNTPGLLLGTADLGAQIDSNTAGNAEAFVYVAQFSGNATELRVYLDQSSSASKLILGVYSDANDSPKNLLATGTLAAPQAGVWNSVALAGLQITAGQRYWIAILAPTGAGLVKFRDISAGGGTTWTSRQNNLTALATTWSNGTLYDNSPASAYLFGSTANVPTPPSVALASPANGSTFTAPASIALAATANDDVAIAKVEFFNGATKIGEALSAPYAFTWTNVAAGAYTLRAVATDNEGLSGSTSISVNVTNPAPSAPTVVFGYNQEGNVVDTITDASGQYINANRFQAQVSRTVSTIRAKVGAIAGKYRTAIYADANGQPGALLASSNELSPTVTGWNNFPLQTPLAVTQGQQYWLAIWSNDTAARVYANNGGGVLRWGKYNYANTWPASPNLDGSGAFIYAIYATDDTSAPPPPPPPPPTGNANLIVSGSSQNQRIVGLGVNANSNAWEAGALKPALDTMVDTVGVSMWRVIVESHLNWETTNDDADPNNFNWTYYNALYETPKFQSLWSVLSYLKGRNVPAILLNVMGEAPPWMGRSVINTSAEDEWVEMITSMLVYARNTKGLRVDYLSPLNEQDLGPHEGPLVSSAQYVGLMNKLRVRMDALGLGDIRFYGAETAYIDKGVNDYLPAMMADANLMSHVAGFALHDYGGSSGGAAARIRASAYADRPFVMTEFSAWCAGCDNGAPQPTDFEFARNSGLYLMNHLSDGAGGALIYDAYDSFYEHHGAIGYWGLMGKNNGSYFARKRMYVMAQFFKYIRPGAVRVNVSSQVSGVNALAFTGGGSSLAVVVGHNSNRGSSADLVLRFDNVVGVKNVQLIQTTPSKDLVVSAAVPLVSGQVTLRVDGDSFFTVLALP